MIPGDEDSFGGELAAGWSRTARVLADGWSVRYRETGTGPTVVLIHGLGVSNDYWYRNAVPIARAGYRVLAPDLPGFGRTAGPRGLSVPDQAAALAAWSDALGLGPAVYVGHSISCQSVVELAACAPERVSALVLAAPTGDCRPYRGAREAWGLFVDLLREPPKLLPVVLVSYLRAGPVRYVRTWRGGLRHDPLACLAEVRAPGVVLVGTRDPVVKRDFAAAFAAGLPDGRLVVIEGGAHALIFDRPQEFNAAVIAFLRSVFSPAAPPPPMPGAAP